MASIYEQQNDVSKELYYLNLAYEKQPNETILKRMSQLATDHGLKGYELNDLNFFVMLYKEYAHYLFALLVLLGAYIFGVLLYKRLRNEFIPFKQKLGLLLFLTGSGLLINLPDSYQSAIVNQDKVFLRNDPSAAAPVLDIIDRGHRLNVLSSDDIWYRVLWDNQLMYIRKQNVWVVD
ncbi:MAG: SH3 domain-containing protein [Spirosomataceae bacterium]